MAVIISSLENDRNLNLTSIQATRASSYNRNWEILGLRVSEVIRRDFVRTLGWGRHGTWSGRHRGYCRDEALHMMADEKVTSGQFIRSKFLSCEDLGGHSRRLDDINCSRLVAFIGKSIGALAPLLRFS